MDQRPPPLEPQEPSTRMRAKDRPTQQFPCPTCGDVFSRIDHLSRHMRSHDPEKAFLCDICGKGFIRADSLSRHARGHDGSNSPNASYRRNLIARVPMACQKCSASKLRCDGAQPCRRCSDKNLRCAYVKRSRRRVKEGPVPPTASQTSSPVNVSVAPGISQPSQMNAMGLDPETMDSVDAQALDALSHAALQARTPPAQTTDMERQMAGASNYLALQTHNAGKHFLTQPIDRAVTGEHPSMRDGENFEQPFAPASTLRSTITNEMEGSWATSEALHHMTFDGPMPDVHEDRVNDASDIENLVFPPFWDTTFDMTDWTTPEFDFHVYMVASFPQADNRADSIIGHNLSTSAFFDEVRPPSHPGFPSPMHHQGQMMMISNQPYSTPNMPEKVAAPNHGSSFVKPQVGSTHPTLTPERNAERSEGDITETRESPAKQDPRATQGQWPTDWEPGKSDHILSFPNFQRTPQGIFDAENFSNVPQVGQNVYDSIVHSIDQIGRDQVIFRPLLDSPPPSLEAINCFVQLYFEYFQPLFPLLHQPTFDPSSGPWILVLAVAAVGCRYSKIHDSAICATALQELLRRSIQHACERDNSVSRKLWLAQSLALNMVGMLYSGDKRLLELALVLKGGLVTTVTRNNSLKAVSKLSKIDENLTKQSLEAAWKLWLREESYRRLGFCCWLLDCQLPLYFDLNPTMGMHEVLQQLPCKELLWSAVDGESWKPYYMEFYRPGSMHSALQALNRKEKLSPAIGDFGKLVLTHAVFMTTWAMRQQSKNPLLQGTPFPSGEDGFRAWQTIANATLNELLPSKPDFSQNSVLRLNLKSHVHHVALLVHVPLSLLLSYARSQAANQGVYKAQQELLSWMKEDNGRKARHAVLHAAVLFSLIREQPCRGFHEPIALLISTLTLWAFHQLSGQQSPRSNAQEQQATVRLDRAFRTQAASSWIENGAELRGYITDVGNICGHGAGKRLLQISSNALLAMDAWALSQGFLHVLSTLQMRLADASSN